MTRLETQRLLPATQVRLRTPPNWTVVGFFAALSSLHLYIATTAMLQQRWEGFMSWIFGVVFAAIAILSWRVGTELYVMTGAKQLRIRTGLRRIYVERQIPFDQINHVRLTLIHPKRPTEARIEIVCAYEVIDCPPTRVPREEALCLAMNMGVSLTKVYSENFSPAAERIEQLPVDD